MNRNKFIFSWIGASCSVFLLMSVSSPVYTQAEADVKSRVEESRLKVGLALGGGGARGVSHIGVLRALEEAKIPIDCIAGTSMGSIIGGLYAAGHSPDEIEEIVADMDWGFALSDATTRENKQIWLKERELNTAHSGRLGVNGVELGLPLGALSGQNLNIVLSRINLNSIDIRDFDNFKIPYRAVATDLVTGEEVVIGSGSIVEAMRASMSVPGVFAPVNKGEMLLVDGGLVNNLPVNVVRDMCADIVIAVNVGTGLMGIGKISSVLAVTEQISTFLTWGNTERTIATLTQQDLLLSPELGDIGSASFDLGPEGIPIAYELTKNALQNWISTQSLAGRGHQQTGADLIEPVIAFINLINNTRLDDKFLRSRIHTKVGEKFNLERLEEDINLLYGLGIFDSVSWDFVHNDAGETGLEVVAHQSLSRRNFMQFGLQLAYDSTSNNDFTLAVAYEKTSINSRGGNLRFDGSLGQKARLSVNLFQPIDMRGNYYVNPIIKYQKRQLNIFLDERKAAELELKNLGMYIGLGRSFGTSGEASVGYERAFGKVDVLSGLLVQPPETFDLGELTFRAKYDSLDSYIFPRSGSYLALGYRLAREDMGSSSDYEQMVVSAIGARTWGKGSLSWRVRGAYSFDNAAPLERGFELGGFGQLSGLVTNQLIGQHYGFASLTWLRYLGGIEALSAFAGASLETGNVWQRSEDIGFDSLRTAGSIFVGADTPLGAIYLGYGIADQGDRALYLYLGNPYNFADGLLNPHL